MIVTPSAQELSSAPMSTFAVALKIQHFRSQLSASVRDIILRTKLERVRSLLEESNLSIGEIAAQCGNMNESHLAVLFKKATGLSMSDYRRQNREPPDD